MQSINSYASEIHKVVLSIPSGRKQTQILMPLGTLTSIRKGPVQRPKDTLRLIQILNIGKADL